MSVAFIQEFAIVDGDTSTSNYDAVVEALNLASAPDGLIVHTAGFDHTDAVFRIFDVWETREQGERFVNEQLNPILQRFMARDRSAAYSIGMAESPEGDFRPPTLESWYDLHDTMT